MKEKKDPRESESPLVKIIKKIFCTATLGVIIAASASVIAFVQLKSMEDQTKLIELQTKIALEEHKPYFEFVDVFSKDGHNITVTTAKGSVENVFIKFYTIFTLLGVTDNRKIVCGRIGICWDDAKPEIFNHTYKYFVPSDIYCTFKPIKVSANLKMSVFDKGSINLLKDHTILAEIHYDDILGNKKIEYYRIGLGNQKENGFFDPIWIRWNKNMKENIEGLINENHKLVDYFIEFADYSYDDFSEKMTRFDYSFDSFIEFMDSIYQKKMSRVQTLIPSCR